MLHAPDAEMEKEKERLPSDVPQGGTQLESIDSPRSINRGRSVQGNRFC